MLRGVRNFPLTNKKLQLLSLPSFYVADHQRDDEKRIAFMGDTVAGGLCDSYTGVEPSQFIAKYLSRALSLHTLLPSEIHKLRQEFPEDELVDYLKMSVHARKVDRSGPHSLQSLFNEKDMQQYAFLADAAFFKTYKSKLDAGNRRGGSSADATGLFDTAEEDTTTARRRIADAGCRAIWFAATVAPTALELQRRWTMMEETQQKGVAPPPQKSLRSPEEDLKRERDKLEEIRARYPFCLDVMVSGVGSSRAFGIVRNPFSEVGKKSLMDPERERMVPLSVDHIPFRTMEYRRITKAGGVLESSKGNFIDGNPFYNVSRSFGHWSMKNNPRLSPVEQKLIPLPNSMSWEMLPGDILVMSNQALYETRGEELSSMDELAKLAGREIDQGRSPEQVAASLCDFAVRFGADHALQVMVAVATEAPPDTLTQEDTLQQLHFDEWIEPGPFYVEPFRHLPPYKTALVKDCQRLGISLAKLLRLRWELVRDILPLRHQLSLMPYYGKECGELQQTMDEEAHLFNHDVLKATDASEEQVDALFHRIAQQLERDNNNNTK